jgi:hypothetical protein
VTAILVYGFASIRLDFLTNFKLDFLIQDKYVKKKLTRWWLANKLRSETLARVYMQFVTHALCSRFIRKAFASIRNGIRKHS